MTSFDWQQFLTDYSCQLSSRTQLLDWAQVPAEARAHQWFGYPPATDRQLARAEERLEIALPDDLREFYRTTNGWMVCGNCIYDIRPVDELCRLAVGSPDLWELCQVDDEPPLDEDDRDWWYEQGIKVCRSLMLNTRGDDATLLFDPEADVSADELRYGTWAAWNPAMDWTAANFRQFFEQARDALV